MFESDTYQLISADFKNGRSIKALKKIQKRINQIHKSGHWYTCDISLFRFLDARKTLVGVFLGLADTNQIEKHYPECIDFYNRLFANYYSQLPRISVALDLNTSLKKIPTANYDALQFLKLLNNSFKISKQSDCIVIEVRVTAISAKTSPLKLSYHSFNYISNPTNEQNSIQPLDIVNSNFFYPFNKFLPNEALNFKYTGIPFSEFINHYLNIYCGPFNAVFIGIDGKFQLTLSSAVHPVNVRIYARLFSDFTQGLVDLKLVGRILISLANKKSRANIRYNQTNNALAFGKQMISGRIIFGLEDCQKYSPPYIFVGQRPLPEHVEVLGKCVGVIYRKGSLTSHVIIVVKNNGLTGLINLESIKINYSKHQFNYGAKEYHSGDWITIDTLHSSISKKEISSHFLENFETQESELIKLLSETFLPKLEINGENIAVIRGAQNLGINNIGLLRLENLITSERNKLIYYRIISAEEPTSFNYQELKVILIKGLVGVLQLGNLNSVNIRLVDFPSNELLSISKYKNNKTNWKEENPMLGKRGARTLVVDEKLHSTQLDAIYDSLTQVGSENLEIFIEYPFITFPSELFHLLKVLKSHKLYKKYHVKCASMVEIPSALHEIKKIAEQVDLVSIGTNDLIQTYYALDREDSEGFLKKYKEFSVLSNKFINEESPEFFTILYQAIKKAKKANENVKISICGEVDFNQSHIVQLIRLGYVTFSVSSSRLASMFYQILDASIPNFHEREKPVLMFSNLVTQDAFRLMRENIDMGKHETAKDICRHWAKFVCSSLGIPFTYNWKIFKKNLIRMFFPVPYADRFTNGWKKAQLIALIVDKYEYDCRISIFPDNISCHSKSYYLKQKYNNEGKLLNLISEIPRTSTIEIFKQAELDNFCFRFFMSSNYNYIEIGKGQAMDVFESTSSLPIIRYSLRGDVVKYEGGMNSNETFYAYLHKSTKQLTDLHYLTIKGSVEVMILSFGLEYLAIEGYFNPISKDYSIVDVDLPFDTPFMSF